jgi:hypothetical protein
MLEQKEGKNSNNIKGVTQIFILLNILHEHGGIMTDGENILVEDLSWISQIMENPHVNRGNRNVKPQVVGFYSMDFSL